VNSIRSNSWRQARRLTIFALSVVSVSLTASANYWRSLLGVQAAWELDFWGKFRPCVESADSAYLASIAT
jgi:outer membrane protein TolC